MQGRGDFRLRERYRAAGCLLLEARKSGPGYRWHYAFARITAWAVTARQGDKEVFSAEKYPFRRDPDSTFLWLPARPLPKQ